MKYIRPSLPSGWYPSTCTYLISHAQTVFLFLVFIFFLARQGPVHRILTASTILLPSSVCHICVVILVCCVFTICIWRRKALLLLSSSVKHPGTLEFDIRLEKKNLCLILNSALKIPFIPEIEEPNTQLCILRLGNFGLRSSNSPFSWRDFFELSSQQITYLRVRILKYHRQPHQRIC